MGLLSPSLHQGSHASFQLGGLSHQGSTGHPGEPPPERPWNDCRCRINLPSECQCGRGKKPTGDGPAVQACRSLKQPCLEREQPGDSLKPLGSCRGTGLWEDRLGFGCLVLPFSICYSSVGDVLGKRTGWGQYPEASYLWQQVLSTGQSRTEGGLALGPKGQVTGQSPWWFMW